MLLSETAVETGPTLVDAGRKESNLEIADEFHRNWCLNKVFAQAGYPLLNGSSPPGLLSWENPVEHRVYSTFNRVYEHRV